MPDLYLTMSQQVFSAGGGITVTRSYPICDVATANYVGVFGVGEPGVNGDGVFFRNTSIRLKDITDGLGQTFAVGERSASLNFGRGRAAWIGSVTIATVFSCVPGGDPDAPGGGCWREDASGMTLGHTGEGHGPGDPRADSNQFGSDHGRGAYFLFCDGHVQYISGDIDYKCYKALSTRAGGELVDGLQY
jgi:prepilin-type processing-associated H-X9-DG protein